MSVLFIVICPIKYFGTKLGSVEQSSSIWDKIEQLRTKWDNLGHNKTFGDKSLLFGTGQRILLVLYSKNLYSNPLD